MVEHLLQPLDLVDGFLAMGGEGFLQRRLLRVLRHLGERLQQLALRVVHVLEEVKKEVIE